MKKIKYILFVFILLYISLSKSTLITTPEGYYNLIKANRFQQYSNLSIEHNESSDSFDTDVYYPDICNGAIPGYDLGVFSMALFPDSKPTSNTLLIIKNSYLIMDPQEVNRDFISVLCIEGSLDIIPSAISVYLSAIVILPGGSLKSQAPIKFIDFDSSELNKDPFNFFPGILALGGSLSLIGSNDIVHSAQRLENNTLIISPGTSKVYSFIRVYTESFPLGLTCSGRYITSTQFTLDSDCLPVSEKIIQVAFVFISETFSDPGIAPRDFIQAKGISIYITGGTNVYLDKIYLEVLGKTSNDKYDDTKLVFSPDDPYNVTDIIMGTNQRYRSSLYIEFSSNVTIKNCIITETLEGRSPLMFFASSVNLIGNLVSSMSGSSVISQYGTELIKSTNNYYFLGKQISNSMRQVQPRSMDYGHEGNGIYSLSPNIISTNDHFIGHNNAFNFNFIANRAKVTGFDKDCYAPCNINSPTLVSNIEQFPVNFKISNPNYSYLTNKTLVTENYLIYINNNGNKPTRYYTITNLTVFDRFMANLGDSVLVLDNLFTNGKFSIDGTLGRLDITNSNIGPSTSVNNRLQELSNATSIKNSYVYSLNPFEKQSNQIYGSLFTPYYYSNTSYIDKIKVVSIFPNEPYRLISNSTLGVVVKLKLLPANSISSLICIFSSDDQIINTTVISFDKTTGSCVLPLVIGKEGSYNIRVIIRDPNSIRPDDYIYAIDFPKIVSFIKYNFYSGWIMDNNNDDQPIQVDGTNFKKGCRQTAGPCTLSNNIKYVTGLPNVTSSNDYNSIFSSGITSIIPNEPVKITTSINETAKIYQIQLFFTYYQPKDEFTSPLSIYIEDQPVFLLEPLSGTGPAFKNTTFTYENVNSLNQLKIAFITRGDIYLTSMALYYSPAVYYNIIPPIIPPIGVPVEIPIGFSFGRILAFSLPIGFAILVLSTLTVIRILIRNKKIQAIKISDIENNISVEMKELVNINNSVLSLDLITAQEPSSELLLKIPATDLITDQESSPLPIISIPLPVTDSITDKESLPIISIPLPDLSIVQEPIPVPDSITDQESPKPGSPNSTEEKELPPYPPILYDVVPESHQNLTSLPMFITDEGEIIMDLSFPPLYHKRPPGDKYRVGLNVRTCLKNSTYFEWNHHQFPLKLGSQTLYYGLDSEKANIGDIYTDILEIENISNQKVNILVLFPTDNNTGVCSAESFYITLEPGEIEDYHVAIKLNCTTKFFEKFALQILSFEGQKSPIYTFVNIHIESVITTHINYRELQFDEHLGKGSQCEIYKGIWRGLSVAIKIKVFVVELTPAELEKEVSIINKMRHRNIVSYIGCVASVKNICLVTEYAPYGSLASLIHDSRFKLSLLQKVRIALDVSRAFQYLHICGVIHRDLKPDNILIFNLDPQGSICAKVCDFDKSRETTSDKREYQFTGQVGTPMYMSNEILESRPYNLSTDVYSFGITLYELIVETIPYCEHTAAEIPFLVICGTRPESDLSKINSKIRNIITNCWSEESNARPTFDEINASLESIYKILLDRQKILLLK